MDALAPSTTLSEIAKADDPIASLADLGRIVTVDGGEVLIFGAPLAAYDPQELVGFRAAFRALSKRIGELAGATEATIEQKMETEGATEVYHPDYEVTYKPTKGDPMVHDELLYKGLTELAEAGKVDPALVRKAVGCETKVVYKHHLTYIGQLRKFGGDVLRVIESAVRDAEPGPARLSIKEKKG